MWTNTYIHNGAVNQWHINGTHPLSPVSLCLLPQYLGVLHHAKTINLQDILITCCKISWCESQVMCRRCVINRMCQLPMYEMWNIQIFVCHSHRVRLQMWLFWFVTCEINHPRSVHQWLCVVSRNITS